MDLHTINLLRRPGNNEADHDVVIAMRSAQYINEIRQMANKARCEVGVHTLTYRYGEPQRRQYPDGSWSNGSEHLGYFCNHCGVKQPHPQALKGELLAALLEKDITDFMLPEGCVIAVPVQHSFASRAETRRHLFLTSTREV